MTENERRANRPQESSRQATCPHGHDLSYHGQNYRRECNQCIRERRRRQIESASDRPCLPKNPARLPALAVARKARGLSQGALGRAAGVSRSSICRYERGEPAHLDKRRKLARALGLRPGELMLAESGRPPGARGETEEEVFLG